MDADDDPAGDRRLSRQLTCPRCGTLCRSAEDVLLPPASCPHCRTDLPPPAVEAVPVREIDIRRRSLVTPVLMLLALALGLAGFVLLIKASNEQVGIGGGLLIVLAVQTILFVICRVWWRADTPSVGRTILRCIALNVIGLALLPLVFLILDIIGW